MNYANFDHCRKNLSLNEERERTTDGGTSNSNPYTDSSFNAIQNEKDSNILIHLVPPTRKTKLEEKLSNLEIAACKMLFDETELPPAPPPPSRPPNHNQNVYISSSGTTSLSPYHPKFSSLHASPITHRPSHFPRNVSFHSIETDI